MVLYGKRTEQGSESTEAALGCRVNSVLSLVALWLVNRRVLGSFMRESASAEWKTTKVTLPSGQREDAERTCFVDSAQPVNVQA